MHPYDGVDYRFSSKDAEHEKAFEIIAKLLGASPGRDELDYSLNFYSGGTGVDDRLAIRCSFDEGDWPAIVQKLRLKCIAHAISDPSWNEELHWLVGAEDSALEIDHDCHRFINENKHDFQDLANDQWEVFFTNESDVNSWCVIWRLNGRLNYLSFDQG